MNHQALCQLLVSLDGRSYKAYKEIQGSYQFPKFDLYIDYVQGDPFAAPSRVRVVVSQTVAGFPAQTYQTRSRAIALRDYLTRQFGQVAAEVCEKRGSGNSGLIAIAPTGQQVLERSAVFVSPEQLEARFLVGLPAQGRQILGRAAAMLFCDHLPRIVEQTLQYSSLSATALQHHIETIEDADWLRDQLTIQGLVAFIPNGAILPRQSGANDRPLAIAPVAAAQLKSGSAVDLQIQVESTYPIPFQSPASLQVEFNRPNQGKISGMGIRTGITLIVGGGYHGKSTLLRAIALGVYNHIPDDGREQLVTHPSATKIRAENGRSVSGVDISPFINHLPQGNSTTHFSTQNASGSTSQASSLIEALEAGATVLLVDEDTSAANFMIRDRRMQALVTKDEEPITPFIDKARQLYQDYSVSTALVMGSSGDYFDVADTIIAMTNYQPHEVTAQAKAIAARYATERISEGGTHFGLLTPRIPASNDLASKAVGGWANLPNEQSSIPERSARLFDKHDAVPIKVRSVDELRVGLETIDLSAVEQLVDIGQVRAIGAAIAYLRQHYLNGVTPLSALLNYMESDINAAGIDILTPYPQGDLARFRTLELAAAFNRLRFLAINNLASNTQSG